MIVYCLIDDCGIFIYVLVDFLHKVLCMFFVSLGLEMLNLYDHFFMIQINSLLVRNWHPVYSMWEVSSMSHTFLVYEYKKCTIVMCNIFFSSHLPIALKYASCLSEFLL